MKFACSILQLNRYCQHLCEVGEFVVYTLEYNLQKQKFGTEIASRKKNLVTFASLIAVFWPSA